MIKKYFVAFILFFLSHYVMAVATTDNSSTVSLQKNSQVTTNNEVNAEIDTVAIDSKELNDLKSKIDDQLLIYKKGERELNWPAFPRIWTERSLIQQRNINLGGTININPFSFGIKLKNTLSNQYTLKTTFVLLSSDKPVDAKVYEKANGKYPIIRTIFKNGSDHLVYPNVDTNFPMVGFCSFEAKYANELQTIRSFSFMPVNLDRETYESEPVSYFVTSKLFQINDKVPIKHYLHTICADLFKSKIEQKVMEDFDKIKHEMEFFLTLREVNLKTGLCEPASKLSKPLSSEESDESCTNWHESNFSGPIAERTIALCRFDKTKQNNYCTLKAKENKTCPMYWDTKTKTYESEPSKTSKSSMSATAGYYEFPCDTANGYECRFTDKPVFLLNVPLIKGRAVCTPVSK